MLKKIVYIILFSLCLSSCFVSRVEVGKGPQLGIQESAKNDYFFWGLRPNRKAEVQHLRKEAKNYRVVRKFDLYDCFWSILTLGFYTRTTVEVTR